MNACERMALDTIEHRGQITSFELADALCWEDRYASRVLLNLQLAGELRAFSVPSSKGPPRKAYALRESLSP